MVIFSNNNKFQLKLQQLMSESQKLVQIKVVQVYFDSMEKWPDQFGKQNLLNIAILIT